MTVKTKAVVFVPYRPVWYYESLGPCVRDWAMIDVALGIASQKDLPALVVDRPSFPPWRSKAAPEQDRLFDLGDVISRDHIAGSSRVSIMSTLLHSRGGSRGPVEKALRRFAQDYDRLLVVDFDPFAQITVPDNAVHWFDEIDDFSKHRRIPRRDQAAFLQKRVRDWDYHTASSLEASVGTPMPNWVFTPLAPAARSEQFAYRFGYLGYVDSKMDLDMVRALAAQGRMGIWGQILDTNVEKSLAAIPNIDLHGAFTGDEMSRIMTQFEIGTIPFILDRIHGNSPIKYYQYSAAQKHCISSSAFGLVRPNLHVTDTNGMPGAIASCTPLGPQDWAGIETQNSEGREAFKALFTQAVDAL